MEPISDEEILDWLENIQKLHQTTEILYVVDGYYFSINNERNGESHRYHGETLRDAISHAMRDYPSAGYI